MSTRVKLLILLLIVLLSVLYVFKGQNWLSEMRLKKRQESREYLFNELIENLLDIQERSEKIINEFLRTEHDFDLFPDPDLEPVINWELKLTYPVTSKPIFDHKNIYLIGGRKISVLEKKSRRILWSRTFSGNITAVDLTDANRILIFLKTDRIINLSRSTGKLVWDYIGNAGLIGQENITSVNVSLEKYLKLESSLIVIPSADSLLFLNNLNGKRIAVYRPEKEIRFVSEFDLLSKSLYIIEGTSLLALELRIKE